MTDTTSTSIDILIVGAGPAGLMLAAQLSRINEFVRSRRKPGREDVDEEDVNGLRLIRYRIVDRAEEKVMTGHADGFQCRTVEVFQALKIAHRVVHEGNEVAEVVFYNPVEGSDGKMELRETKRMCDTTPGTSHFKHYLLGQARIEQFLMNCMEEADEHHVERPILPISLTSSDSTPNNDYPVTVTLQHLPRTPVAATTKNDPKSGLYRSNLFIKPEEDAVTRLKAATGNGNGNGDENANTNGERHGGGGELNGSANGEGLERMEEIRCKYVVGCDGARSWVRKQIGESLKGDSANVYWGVIDAKAKTNLPTIRMKNTIHSAESGSILTVPRERGFTRFYVQLGILQEGERVNRDDITAERIIARAQKIFEPYMLECPEVEWFTCYEIGQRLCDRFVKGKVFIAGDACHTHSPKAGQGMNTSMMDTFNLGWKLASVIQGTSDEKILETYQTERHAVASDLINFDRKIAALFSGKPGSREQSGVSIDDFHRLWEKFEKWTTGTAIVYQPSAIVAESSYDMSPSLARNILIGSHFETHQVVCCGTAHAVQLQHALLADGRWRLILFPGDIREDDVKRRLTKFCAELDSSTGPIRANLPRRADLDSRVQILTVFATPRKSIDLQTLPAVLTPEVAPHGIAVWDTIFADDNSFHDGHGHAYDNYGIRGACAVLVRPDQYVAGVWAPDSVTGITAFLASTFATEQRI